MRHLTSCLLAMLAAALLLPARAEAAKVVEYLFEGNANDTSGNGEHGTLVGGATFGTSYDGSGALSLDGLGDAVAVALGNYTISTFTLELWLNVPTYTDNVHYISLYQNAYLVLGDYGSGAISTWADGLSPVDAGGSGPIPTANAWHHFAHTYDGVRQRLYIDGVETASVTTSGSVTNNTSSHNQGLVIGARYNQSTQWVDGLLDNVRIWDEALPVGQLGFFADGTTSGDSDGDGDPNTTDCDDTDPSIYTGAPELCDSIDSDCDGDLVDGFTNTDGDSEPDCVDLDDDGDGDPDATDCFALNPAFYNGAPELCDGLDSDCDGSIVDEFPDSDGDGDPDCIDGDIDGDGSPTESDCDDGDASIFPGAPELCDEVDSDCDGSIVDEDSDIDGDLTPDCVDDDADGDGFDDVLVGGDDCDDEDSGVYPGAEESCDLVDSDCDGDLVDGEEDLDGDGVPDCVDDDQDGDFETAATDCDDNDPTIYTGAPEACDDIDSDCDGDLVDDFLNTDTDAEPDCIDEDDDADGSPDTEDCAPLDGTVHPDADEDCSDEVDNDCDGDIDADDSECASDGGGDRGRGCQCSASAPASSGHALLLLCFLAALVTRRRPAIGSF